MRFILDNCNARANEKGVVGPKSVLIIAHSMGGISARGAVFAKKLSPRVNINHHYNEHSAPSNIAVNDRS